MSWLFASCGQSIRASASTSVLLMNIQVISSRIDWFDHLAVQGTLKSLLQHHNSKAPILQCSTFFMVQLSNPYMTIGKTIALDLCRQSDVSAFEYAVRFAITFLPRSKHILFYLFFLEV